MVRKCGRSYFARWNKHFGIGGSSVGAVGCSTQRRRTLNIMKILLKIKR